jgi:maltose alpha-D-glucosyltransferase/alpha-amylase
MNTAAMNPAERALRALTPAALARHLTAQRWFGALGETITSARILEVAPMPDAAEPAALTRVHVCFASGAAADYQVPLAVDAEGDPASLHDALQRPTFRRQLGHAFARGAEIPTTDNDAAWVFEPLTDLGELEELPSRPGAGEQSNTSIVYGERAILKIYRRLEPGIHPEVEICRFLTACTDFRGTPPLLGVLRLRTAAGEAVAGMLQAFVPDALDGWHYVLDALADGAERCDDDGALDREVEALGRLTAELHAALASTPDGPDSAVHFTVHFTPRPTTDADIQRWRAAADAQLTATLGRLAARHTDLPPRHRRRHARAPRPRPGPARRPDRADRRRSRRPADPPPRRLSPRPGAARPRRRLAHHRLRGRAGSPPPRAPRPQPPDPRPRRHAALLRLRRRRRPPAASPARSRRCGSRRCGPRSSAATT